MHYIIMYRYKKSTAKNEKAADDNEKTSSVAAFA